MGLRSFESGGPNYAHTGLIPPNSLCKKVFRAACVHLIMVWYMCMYCSVQSKGLGEWGSVKRIWRADRRHETVSMSMQSEEILASWVRPGFFLFLPVLNIASNSSSSSSSSASERWPPPRAGCAPSSSLSLANMSSRGPAG